MLEIVNAKQAENYGVEIEGGARAAARLGAALRRGAARSPATSAGCTASTSTSRPSASSQLGRSARLGIQRRDRLLRQAAPELARVQGERHRGVDLRPRALRLPDPALRRQLERRRVLRPQRRARLGRSDRARPRCPNTAIGQKAYFLHNVRLAYRTPTGNVEVAGWVRNVEDQVYKNFAFDASQLHRRRDQLRRRAAHDRRRRDRHVLSAHQRLPPGNGVAERAQLIELDLVELELGAGCLPRRLDGEVCFACSRSRAADLGLVLEPGSRSSRRVALASKSSSRDLAVRIAEHAGSGSRPRSPPRSASASPRAGPRSGRDARSRSCRPRVPGFAARRREDLGHARAAVRVLERRKPEQVEHGRPDVDVGGALPITTAGLRAGTGSRMTSGTSVTSG